MSEVAKSTTTDDDVYRFVNSHVALLLSFAGRYYAALPRLLEEPDEDFDSHIAALAEEFRRQEPRAMQQGRQWWWQRLDEAATGDL